MLRAAVLALMIAFAAPALAQTPPAAASRFTLDTPIETIAADPKGKAVLDAVFPEMLGHPEYPNFRSMSLTEVQPLAQGAITDAMMAQAKAQLATIR